MADSIETESAEALLSIKNGGYKVKRELDFGDEAEQSNQPMTLGPEMFGLKRVGEPHTISNSTKGLSNTLGQVPLNRRGTPARIRKKNPLFFDEEMIVSQPSAKSPRKSIKNPTNAGKDTVSSPSLKLAVNRSSKKGQSRSAPGSIVGTPERRNALHVSSPGQPAGKPKSKYKKNKIRPSLRSPSEKPKPEIANSGRKIRSLVPNGSIVSSISVTTSAGSDSENLKKLGVRLRNLLKLPKAHKWVCYEWFYSNLDQALFEGDNDFVMCLRESFPNLKLRQLTRSQWCTIRRLMGRPRRCSQAFFNEERGELAKKRQKIRLVQQRKVQDMTSLCRDLPDLIPMPLVIGTKVTARLRQPQDGLFVGQIDAVDTSNNTYRITFDRQGLGTHSVPDYEVLSNDLVDMISISSLAQRFRPRPTVLPSASMTSPGVNQQLLATSLKTNSTHAPTPAPSATSNGSSLTGQASLVGDPVLGSSQLKFSTQDSTFGTFPMHVLTPVVRLSKVLNLKKEKISGLREMNTEAERKESVGETVAQDFQRRYARTILDLEELNSELNTLLGKVRQQCSEIAPDSEQGLSPFAGPDSIRHLCYQEARELVETQIDSQNGIHVNVSSPSIISLVTGLTSLMLQIKCLAESERNAYELQALHDSLEDLRTSLDKTNVASLRNHVLVHVQHIQSGLCNFENVTLISGSDPNVNVPNSITKNSPGDKQG